LPYILADIQHQIEKWLDDGYDPGQLFHTVYTQFDKREWLTIVNYTIVRTIEKEESRATCGREVNKGTCSI